MKILVLNAGSSSQKSCLYELPGSLPLPDCAPQPLWKGEIDWGNPPGNATLSVRTSTGQTWEATQPSNSRAEDTLTLLQTLWSGETAVIEDPQMIDVVGHRVVHGGVHYSESVWIDATVKAEIKALSRFAPLHNPVNLAGIEGVEQILGGIPQIAVFDTAFHAHLPDAAAVYPLPLALRDLGIRRYGFHGISHQYCAQRAAQILGRDLHTLRLVNCHLGNGCSLAAIAKGRSVDTTMGFTPLDGLMMGSRSGSVDPGILLHLLREHGHTVDSLDHLLNHQSGLLGVSGVSGDMRHIQIAIAHDQPHAKLALDIYLHRLCAQIASMLPSLRGMDALIFTAGIGEHDANLRAAVCERLEFLGLKLDRALNQPHPQDQDIAQADSPIRILVIHTQEDWAIAQDCFRLMEQQALQKAHQV